MSRHEDDAWSQPPEVEDRDLSDDEEPAPVCLYCDNGMCGCNDEKAIADIEVQIERLHFFMTVSPFEGIR